MSRLQTARLCYNQQYGHKSRNPLSGPNAADDPEERAASDEAIAKAKASGHPLAQYAGISRDDPTFDDYLAAIREYRREVEEDPRMKLLWQS